eukprot:234807-Chlamydomonas_euryale.AAC.1
MDASDFNTNVPLGSPPSPHAHLRMRRSGARSWWCRRAGPHTTARRWRRLPKHHPPRRGWRARGRPGAVPAQAAAPTACGACCHLGVGPDDTVVEVVGALWRWRSSVAIGGGNGEAHCQGNGKTPGAIGNGAEVAVTVAAPVTVTDSCDCYCCRHCVTDKCDCY